MTDSQADDLIAACHEHNIYSRDDLERSVTSLRALASEIREAWGMKPVYRSRSFWFCMVIGFGFWPTAWVIYWIVT